MAFIKIANFFDFQEAESTLIIGIEAKEGLEFLNW